MSSQSSGKASMYSFLLPNCFASLPRQVVFLFRVSMNLVEKIRVSQEGAEARFRAQIDCAASVFDAREICWIGIPEDASAKGDQARMFFVS
jgi:hypothetical protein